MPRAGTLGLLVIIETQTIDDIGVMQGLKDSSFVICHSEDNPDLDEVAWIIKTHLTDDTHDDELIHLIIQTSGVGGPDILMDEDTHTEEQMRTAIGTSVRSELGNFMVWEGVFGGFNHVYDVVLRTEYDEDHIAESRYRINVSLIKFLF